MNVAILGGRDGWHARVLAEALQRRGIAPRLCPISDLTVQIGFPGRPNPPAPFPAREGGATFKPADAAMTSRVREGPGVRAGSSPLSVGEGPGVRVDLPSSPLPSQGRGRGRGLPAGSITAGAAVGDAGAESLDDCDVVLVRAIPTGSLEQIIFRMDVLHRLELAGVRVVNGPRCLERTVDKYFTSALLDGAGLPTPRTVVAERFDAAMAAFGVLGGDVVVKPLFGSEGKGIVRVSDPDLAYRTFRALELARSVFYLQEFIPHADEDLRAFVVGGSVVAAMRRRGRTWKTNFSQGASTEAVDLSPELADLAVRAAAVVEADYAGVDLMIAESGAVFVVEVNGIPGWAGLQRTTRLDLADCIVEHALSLARLRG